MPKHTPDNSQTIEVTMSPALQYITTSRNSLPKGIGDRQWHAFMSSIMELAITNRMVFDKDDGDALVRLSARCQYGVFNPIAESWYILACRAGGTYCRMYEKAVGLTPWVAPLVLVDQHRGLTPTKGRVAPQMGVVLPKAENDDTHAETTRDGDQVWWCTSLTDDQIILCRYRQDPDQSNSYRSGPPINRWKLSRGEWKDLHAAEQKEAAHV
ncbi:MULTISPECIES: hypothetical protein [Polaromonas]|uniref:Uncharacterized protein n=1 Tax=Polaromonas aquatica TaxID=332657 RepID=A0ABW1TX02_9BURK